MLANFMIENESDESQWVLAKEPSDCESEVENPDDEVSCENCNKKFVQSTILKHIGHNANCKSHYGPRFEDMKRKKNRHKKRKSRQKLGTKHEMKKQRGSYKRKNEKMGEKSSQQLKIKKADRENILHWNLASEFIKLH